MILVTGGTGLLGSHLLYNLAINGETVRVLYRNESRKRCVENVFKYYSPQNYENLLSNIEWFEGNILDLVSLDQALERVSIVYHCAGIVSFAKKDFNKVIKINREGTANVVNTCLDKGVQKLCYVSSTAAIGGENNTIITEKTKWELGPETSAYSISKYSAEKEVWRGVEEGLDCVIVNPSVIFGSGNWNESSLTIFRTVKKGLRFYTNGVNGFVDARDVAEIMIKLTNSEIKNERFLCVGHNVSFKTLLELIAIQLNKKPPTINTPMWMLGLTWRVAGVYAKLIGKSATITKDSARSAFNHKTYDCNKVKKQLNYTFKSLEDTIENTVNGEFC